ncbi:hypothetical protein QFZ74_005148 [Streptomyces sp. V3I7]|nr:hypothetical protein [Streptomyces sp. V3I7]
MTDPSPGDLYQPGGVGIRGDNTEFGFRDIRAHSE